MSQTIATHRVNPENTCLETLSPLEMARLAEISRGEIHPLIVRCILAVLNSGSESDDVKQMLSVYHDFDLKVIDTPRGVEVELKNVPDIAFVQYDSEMDREGASSHKLIEGLRQHIFSVIRDLAFVQSEIQSTGKFDLDSSQGITDAVFLILRNAGIFSKTGRHKVVAFWGGHAIGQEEYQFSLELGNQCGLRFMDVITGCGPGAMRGPMEGATIGHAKQRMPDGRYIGVTEPGIIASEAPNPIVNPLVIMPDIEKRLEAFVRMGQGIMVFPGGVGTLEELCYLLGVLTHPKNRGMPFPCILTGPESAGPYWQSVTSFLEEFLGSKICRYYQVILGDAARVAQAANQGLLRVKKYRDKHKDSYYFNTRLYIPFALQKPFIATHESVRRIKLGSAQSPHERAANLRRVFSAIVSGNVRPEGIKAVEEKGPFNIRGDKALVRRLERLLRDMADQGRMKLKGDYLPCYITEV